MPRATSGVESSQIRLEPWSEATARAAADQVVRGRRPLGGPAVDRGRRPQHRGEGDKMSSIRCDWARSRGPWLVVAIALAVGALCASAAAASASKSVNIVRQSGPPPGAIPKGTQYFTTIQAAVNASSKGDWVLIEPGTYYEAGQGDQRAVRHLDPRHEPQHGDPRRPKQTGQRHRNLQDEQRLGRKPHCAQLRHRL